MFKPGSFSILKLISKIEKNLKSSFSRIKSEFDEHREAINQNTNEIQHNYEFLCKLDSKIERLNERIDELTMFIHSTIKQAAKEKEYCLFNGEQNYNDKQSLHSSMLCPADEKSSCYPNAMAEKETLACSMPRLTTREKEVFLVLYAMDKELSYSEIAERAALTESLVISYITNLIAKGIPVKKRYSGGKVFLRIDKNFKHLQAKSNIVTIDESISKRINLS